MSMSTDTDSHSFQMSRAIDKNFVLTDGRAIDARKLPPGSVVAPDSPDADGSHGMTGSVSIESLLATASIKKINTDDFEYMKRLNDTRRRNEQDRKRELEAELREFRKLKLQRAIAKRKEDAVGDSRRDDRSLSLLPSSISSQIKIKRKNVPDKIS